MVEALRAGEDRPPEGVLDAVNHAVAAFIGDEDQFDDLTMLCLHYLGK
jgi:serine phosphatase RsbU (regulator of sigma subunit)